MPKNNLILLILIFLLALTNAARACDHVGAYIVNLSQDEDDKDDISICTSRPGDSEIRACISARIAANLPNDCRERIDIFVPGTAAEHGAWKQFNTMFRSDNNRAHLVLRYQDARDVESVFNFDGATYDQGVIDARTSLILLLDALAESFANPDVRVFGHSKGSHAVALVADDPGYQNVHFYAFAQPGRTAVDIDNDSSIKAGRLGEPGFIEKLSNNLVGITWRNDEVQYYRGNSILGGTPTPEKWSFPGFIWQDTIGGADKIEFRIDHHNNYGGDYTDGLSSNDWTLGDGTQKGGYPYCTTGDRVALDDPECDTRQVTFAPYFWSNPECRAVAFQMMAGGSIGDRYEIGYSGPRAPRSCAESSARIKVDYDIEYRFNLSDKDCRYHLRIAFTDIISGKETDQLPYSATEADDSVWRQDSGEVIVPYHMHLSLEAWMVEESQGGLFPDCENYTLNSELYIRSLRLNFTHPATGKSVGWRTVIGQKEGRGYIEPIDLHRKNNVAWEQPNRDQEDLRLYFNATYDAINISGNAVKGYQGNFRKRLHLLD